MRHFNPFIFLLIILSGNCYGQDAQKIQKQLDSLESIIPKDPKTAQLKLNHLNVNSKKINYQKGLFYGYRHLGTAYLYQGKMDSAKISFKEALTHEIDIPLKDRAALRNNLALALQKLGENEASYKNYNESLYISRLVNDSLGIARSCFNIGTYFRSQGNFTTAIKYFNESLEIYSKLKLTNEISQVLNSLGLIKKSMKDYKKALDFFHESLILRQENNDLKGIMDVENNIAATYIDLKDFETALTHQNISLELAEQTMNYKILAGSYTNLGIIYKELRKPDKALEFYERAMDLFSAVKNKQGLLTTYTNLGLLELETNSYSKAETHLVLAKSIAEEMDALESIIKINRGLSHLYSKMGKHEAALKVYIELNQLSDSIFRIESAKQLTEIQEKYETAKKNEAIQALETKSALDDKNRKIQNQNIQLLVIALIAVLLLFFSLYLRYTFKKKLHQKEKEELQLKEVLALQELEIKNRKLTSFAAETLQKNQFIEELNALIETIKIEGVTNQNLSAYNNLLQANKQEKNNWDTFKIHFENVHPEFFQKLSETYPKFTPNDLRICAYIKMGLLNKEIASLMNIAPSSVKMSKNRIKKKMNLGEEDSLQAKIDQF